MKLKQVAQKKPFTLFLISITIFKILLSFQGFEVCDEGYALTFYQQIFSYAESIKFCFLYYLTGVVGGIWYKLIPNGGGIFGFRMLYVVFTIVNYILVYKILKPFINTKYIIIGLIVAALIDDFGIIAFHSNHLVFFFTLFTIYFLLKGIFFKSNLFILLSGFFIGLNIFSRLPTVVQISFVLVILFYTIVNSKRIVFFIEKTLFFVLGIGLGVLSVLFLMYKLDHLELFKNTISFLFEYGSASDSSHSFERLLKQYTKEYLVVLKLALKTISSFFAITFLFYLSRKKRTYRYVFYFFISLILIFMFKVFRNENLYAFCFVGIALIFFIKNVNNDFKTLLCASLLMMLLLPVGSDFGIGIMGRYGIILAMPLTVWSFDSVFNVSMKLRYAEKFYNFNLNDFDFKWTFKSLFIGYVLVQLFKISNSAYFDKGSRFFKTVQIDNKFTKFNFTSKKQAEVVNQLLGELEIYVRPNDFLFVYDKAPMLHFLTETRPYIKTPWVWGFDAKTFDLELKKAEIKMLPIVVTQKMETIGGFSLPKKDYLSIDKENSWYHNNERTESFLKFLERNEYKTVWENDYFSIMKPSNVKL